MDGNDGSALALNNFSGGQTPDELWFAKGNRTVYARKEFYRKPNLEPCVWTTDCDDRTFWRTGLSAVLHKSEL